MNVLSLFDGMSCGQIALQRLGVKVDKYFASEIDKHAIKASQAKWPDMIHLGCVTDVKASDLPQIDLIIAGSPCQGFSRSGKGLNFNDPRSMLFFEFVRILNECRQRNPNILFKLENVRMKKEWEDIISRILEIQPIFINSALVSAQNRERLYWTNIGMKKRGLFDDNYCSIPQPKDKKIFLNDILEDNVDSKYHMPPKAVERILKSTKINPEKAYALQTNNNSQGGSAKGATTLIVHNLMPRSSKSGKGGTGQLSRADGKTYCLDTGVTNAVQLGMIIRRLTPIECCRCQTVPDDYFFDNTCVGGQICSDRQIYKMTGNGWTVDVICHILSYANFTV